MIIDLGTSVVKAGYGGEDAPRAVFPNICGYLNRPAVMIGTEVNRREHYVGDDAQTSSNRGRLTLIRPMERGVINKWEAIEKILHHIFATELYGGSTFPTLLTERVFTPTAQRDKLSELMFERFEVPALNFAMSEVLAVWAGGRNTALVVDVGEGAITVMPMHYGYIIRAGVVRANYGGADLTDYLQKLLTERGYYLNTSQEREIVRHIKESTCYVALDFEADLRTSLCSTQLEKSYELPDGQNITIASERFRCGEALFQPSLMGKELPGIHQLIEASINKIDMDVRWVLRGNINLAGGTTMLPGFADRLQKEMKNLSPTTAQVRVVAMPERKYSSWIGGSILASCTAPEKWFSKEEYDEYGPSYSRKKHLYL